MTKKKTNEECIRDFRKVHGDKYDYSKFDNINAHTNSVIICPKHGEFLRTPNDHLNGVGCPICGEEQRRDKRRNKIADVIKRCNIVHNNKYDYSQSFYTGGKKEMYIICPMHGGFWMRADHHLSGCGCQKCANEKLSKLFSSNTEDFIRKSKIVHGNKYNYSEVKYINEHTDVNIICPIHGIFPQNPSHHLVGKGCQKCNSSHMENEIINLLEEQNINYIYQANKKDLKWLEKLSLDFYLPKYNIAIECQGIQHFKAIDYFGGKYKYERAIIRDKNKLDFCIKHGVELLYYANYDFDFPYKVITNKEELLNKIKSLTINK